jgi:hypothetical protein
MQLNLIGAACVCACPPLPPSRSNGGDNPVGAASNYPLLGRKCLSWEGGTRTFAFVSGGLIPLAKRGTTNNQLMHVADW